MFNLYLLITFIIFFFTYQVFKSDYEDESNKRNVVIIFDNKYFWIIWILPITWIISLPLIGGWKLLKISTTRIIDYLIKLKTK